MVLRLARGPNRYAKRRRPESNRCKIPIVRSSAAPAVRHSVDHAALANSLGIGAAVSSADATVGPEILVHQGDHTPRGIDVRDDLTPGTVGFPRALGGRVTTTPNVLGELAALSTLPEPIVVEHLAQVPCRYDL
jgi:hypothetical protein